MADSETGESEVKKDSTEPTETKIESVKEEAKAQPEKKKSEKVEVRLQAAGDAPIMKQKNYNVDKEKPISWILAFIRRYLKFQSHESLYLYVNQAFSPSPDQTVGNLADCFAQDNKLVLYYSKGQAWG